MTKTAFLFAGQGAQYQGMARDLYDQYEVIRSTFDEASQVLGYDVRSLIDHDPEKLHQTRYTQPAILTTSIAIYRLLLEVGAISDIVAGLSLGEYSALVAAGALDFKTAVDLVAKRGAFMEEAAPQGTGKMVAVLNTEGSLIEKVCEEASSYGLVSPANYNTPSQIVIGGENQAVDQAVHLLKEAGVKRMIPLNVSGPFHTALLQEASEKLTDVLSVTPFSAFSLPVVGNTEAKVMKEGNVRELLARQVKEPVRFYDSIYLMKEKGVTTFIEIGPGKVLSGFLKKIDQTATLFQVDTVDSFQFLLENRGG